MSETKGEYTTAHEVDQVTVGADDVLMQLWRLNLEHPRGLNYWRNVLVQVQARLDEVIHEG